MNYRYKLDTGSKQHICPGCNKRRFVRYIDTTTGEYLPGDFGRCNREANCGYHVKPKPDIKAFFVPFDTIENHSPKSYKITIGANVFYLPKSQCFDIAPGGLYASEFILKDTKAPRYIESDFRHYEHGTNTPVKLPEQQQKKDPFFMPFEALQETLTGYHENQFVNNLLQNIPFPVTPEMIEKVISMYYLGTITTGYLKGGVCFPFIDINGNIRTIQAKTFDKANHTIKTGFYHAILSKRNPRPGWLPRYLENESFVSCLFGEHLLAQYPNNPVALIEAPKGAILGSLYFGLPDESPANMIWIAAYNLSSLTLEKCKVLQGRFVTLFPDLSKTGRAFELWAQRAKEFNQALPGTKFTVSDLLETKASPQEREAAADLADYLVKYDWRSFKEQPPAEPEPQPEPQPEPISTEKNETIETNEPLPEPLPVEPLPEPPPKPETWEHEVKELEAYFTSIQAPRHAIKLNQCSTILNCSKFIESHLNIVKANNGNRIYKPYLNRLKELKEILIHN